MADTTDNLATPVGGTPTPTSTPKQEFDWLAVQAQAPDKTPTDLYGMGITPSSVTLQNKDFYKKSPKIQEAFKMSNGGFDEKAFNQYYVGAQKTMNEFQKSNFDLGNVTTDLWEDTSVARAVRAPINRNPVKVSLTSNDPFSNLKAAQQSFYGLSEIGKWTQPKKTLEEVAQGQKVIDGLTGKELDYTPEEGGLSNLFGFARAPLALAQYDDDIKDAQGRVIHKRGELKLDAQGLPRYETLAGRDPSGRQMLSAWNTLTKEDSFANKLDFMDSDDMEKSWTGAIVKGATQLLPLALGGPVSAGYQAYYIASNLLNATAQIGKSIDAIMNDDAKDGSFYKWANELQGYIGQARTGQSEYANEHLFSLESLANQAVDAVLMMTAQSSLASWPTRIRQYQVAKQLGVAEGSSLRALTQTEAELEAIGKQIFDPRTYLAKYPNQAAAIEALQKNYNQLEKLAKYSSYMATGYMATTSTTSIAQAAKQSGLNDKDTGLLYLGYVGAMTAFFRTDLARWVEKGLDVDKLAKDMHEQTLAYASKYLAQDIAAAGIKVGTDTAKSRGIQIMAAGRKLGQRIVDLYNDASMAKFRGFGTAAIAEGLEEASEEVLLNGAKQVYNSLSNAGLTSSKNDARFDLTPENVMAGILQAGFGGAFAGAIFHALPHGTARNQFESQDMMEYVLNGYGSKIVDKIEDLRQKGQLGSTTLSVTPLTDTDGTTIKGMWAPANADNPMTQNDFVADRMTKTVNTMEAIRRAYGVDELNRIAEVKTDLLKSIVDTKTDTDLRDQILETTQEIHDIVLSLQQPETESAEGMESAEGLTEKKARLSELTAKLEYLKSDESLDEFFRQGLFNIRTDINSAFGVKTRDDFAKQVNPRALNYASLSGTDKNKADQLFDAYRDLEGPEGMKADLKSGRKEFDDFNENMETQGHYRRLDEFKQSLESLKDYSFIGVPLEPYRDAEGNVVSPMTDIALHDDYLSRLSAVKYIPDYIYDKIQKDLKNIESEGAAKWLEQLTPNLPNTKESLLTNFRNIDATIKSPEVKNFMSKKLGEKAYEEFLNSVEFKDIIENGKDASNYSILKVLKSLTAFKDDPKTEELRGVRRIVEAMTNEAVSDMVDDYVLNGNRPESPYPSLILDYLDSSGAGQFIKDFSRVGITMADLADSLEPRELLRNALLVNHLDKVGGTISDADRISMVQDVNVSNNVILSMAIDHSYNEKGNVLRTEHIQLLDTTPLDNAVENAKKFNAKRVQSPIAEAIEDTTDFINTQYAVLERDGYSNYLNSDPTFIGQFDEHLASIRRMQGLVEAATSINPLVNDFRKNNPAALDESAKGLELFAISSEDSSYLQSELSRMAGKVRHLKEVNEFNKNNVLARLLKQGGLDLSSKYQTLKGIATNSEVITLLPSLTELFNLQSVSEYAETYKTASNELRSAALYEMAKFEDSVYADFSRLGAAEKSKVINLTFKPIDVSDPDFYDSSDGSKPYNDFAQTIYLAKIYGSSSMDFYQRYAGAKNAETGLFSNLERLKHVPFTNQEAAVRLAHLLMHGDRSVVERLYNAYSTQPNDLGEYNFDHVGDLSVQSLSSVTVWGGPGTGKTTAVLNNIINLLPSGTGDVLLLAPKDRQVKSLVESLTTSGFEDRIDQHNSKIFREFLKDINLHVKSTNKPYDVQSNDAKVDFGPEGGSPTIQFKRVFESGDDTGTGSTKVGTPITEAWDIYKSSNDESWTLSDAIVNKLGKYKLIAIDEYTHINPLDLAMLHRLVDNYNGSTTVQRDPSKRITIVELGDPTQMGYIGKDGVRRDYTSLTHAIVSQPLTTSLRSGWDLVNNTLVDIQNRAIRFSNMSGEELSSSTVLLESKNTPIKANYTFTDDGSIGIKTLTKQGETKEADLSFITANKNRFTGKDLVYVTQDADSVPKAQALLKATLGDNWNLLADIYTPSEIQGGEYKYAIVDASPAIASAEEGGSDYNMKRVHEFLNTMLSRATEATLFLNDGKINEYVQIESSEKEKAIRQTKLTDEVKLEIKKDKQALLAQILQDYTGTAEPSQPKTSVEQAQSKAIAVVPAANLATLFGKSISEPVEAKESAGNLISYNSFSTAQDFDTIFKLQYPGKLAQELSLPENQRKISNTINSYKYYLLHRDELGDRRITLKNNFQGLFDSNDLLWEEPQFYLEIGPRGTEGFTQGRTTLNARRELHTDLLVHLKVRLLKDAPTVEEQQSGAVDLTMGFLNDLDTLVKVDAKNPSLGEMSNFFKSIKDFLKGNGPAPEIGESFEEGGARWRSAPLSDAEFKDISRVYNSRLDFANGALIDFKTFREEYFDFAITEPQVVVANLVGDNGKSILDPSNNPNYDPNLWASLKGKAIVFISDVYELNELKPKEFLNHYIKQLSYFNTPEFAALDQDGKSEYINAIAEKGDVITLSSGLEVKYKPGLVKMIKLDNPTSDFLDFRERFLRVIQQKGVGAKMTPALFEQFNTSLYVKDRLVKSLLTLRAFLNDADKQAWIQENIIDEADKVADNWLDDLYQRYADEYNDGEPADRDLIKVSELSLKKSGRMTLKAFKEGMDELLSLEGEDSIYRGKYPTQEKTPNPKGLPANSKVGKADIDTDISTADLQFKLTGDKVKDFSGSLIDLKLFNLFNKTKNANFARLIDISLKTLGSFENNANFRKYDLSKVFKNGQIESIVIAQDDRSVDRTQNVIADATQFGGDFTFNLGQLTHPYYSIDFNKLMKTWKGEAPQAEVQKAVDSESKIDTELTPKSMASTGVEPEPVKEIEAKPTKKIELNDVISNTSEDAPWNVTVRDRVIDELRRTIGSDTAASESAIDPVSSTHETATYTVTTPDGSQYEMQYNMENDTMKTTPIDLAETADPKAILKAIEQAAMEDYRKMVSDMFGTEPVKELKPVLDYFEQTFRYTMLSSNITSMNAKFSLAEYAADLKDYSENNASSQYEQYITDNRTALRPYSKQQMNMIDYINRYTPNIC